MDRYGIRKALGLACSLVFVLFLCAPHAFGQAAPNGAILGSVTDPSGAVVPQAKVTVVNPNTGQKWETQTSGGGLYDIEALLAEGTLYDVTVEKQGFQTFVSKGNYLSPGARITVNVTLQLAGAVSAVTVSASGVNVETTTGASSGTIVGGEVTDLQLNGRDFRGLALLIPGVNSGAITGGIVGGGALNGGGLTGETPISVNGTGRETNNYTTDGAYNMNSGNNINLDVTQPFESIAEFTLLKDNYSAKYGVAGGANILLATKSGSSTFHGVAYDFLRNDDLDSRNYFAASTPILKQNIFGGSIGGPIYIPGHYNTQKNKTFFFANVELRRRNVGVTALGATVPQAMRNGDFTADPTPGFSGFSLDPTAQAILASEHPGVNCVPDAHHLNTACMDPNAVLMMNKYFPAPNTSAYGNFYNYLNSGVELFHGEDYTFRVDQNIGEKLRLLGRVSHENIRDSPPYETWGANPFPTSSQEAQTFGWNNTLQLTYDINPTTINQVAWTNTATHVWLKAFGNYLSDLPGFSVNLPYGNADPDNRLPQVSLAGGWPGIGPGSLPLNNASDGEQVFSEDFTKVKGPHTIQAGTLFIWGIKRQTVFAPANGDYGFTGVHTADPVADFLLGLDTYCVQYNNLLRNYSRYHQSESYIQDDWRATRRLTLNLGLRVVYFSSDKREGNGLDDFNPATYNPTQAAVVQPNGLLETNAAGLPITATGTVANLLNGLVFAGGLVAKNAIPGGTPGVPNGIFTTHPRLGPRLGFAWDVFGNGKTSVRGGYGIGYSRDLFLDGYAMANYPFLQSKTLLYGTLTNPSLGFENPSSSPALVVLGMPPGRDYTPTMVQSWSLTVQRQLMTNGVFSLAYVGTGARHVPGQVDNNSPLPVAAPSINNPGCLSAGETSNPSGGFNFDPCINKGLVSADYTRPYKGWSSMTGADAAQYYGTLNYNSLQAGFNYRAQHGLTFTAAYTWQNSLSDVADRGIAGLSELVTGQNSRNLKAEYGPTGWDRTQIFTSGYIWNIPLLKNRKGPVATAFGNWTFSGLTVIQSGFVFAPGLGTPNPGLATRPDCVSGQSISGPKTTAEWFNTAAFTAPAFGFFGNCGTGLIRGPGENTWNWSLFKTFPIKERLRLQFRAEFFNIWNHANFSTVQTAYGAGGFGEVTGALDPRQIEFALRLSF